MSNNYTPTVTAIIPCWRCKETIERAINSVYSQTIRPTKLILIDDASGDGTVDLLESIASRFADNWIEVIKLSSNAGPGPARNAGWDRSASEYIAFLDADDAWHPKKIELQLTWMRDHPEASISGHTSTLYNAALGFETFTNLGQPKHYGLFEMIISNRMITRTVMLKTNLPYRFKGKNVTEDYLLWLEMALDNLKLYKFEEPLAVSFREEFSAGGYSGNLWKHELRELNAIRFLYNENKLGAFTFTIFSIWSTIKYFRRVILRRF